MTWKISILGQVQGVGFRPFVWRSALDKNLKGWVANGLQGVVIKINASENQAIDFQEFILKNAPKMSRITGSSIERDADEFFENFAIQESENKGLPILLLTPDVSICPACRDEISDPENRRFRYAFTTCTVCGPRFSILKGVPYDRFLTTMRHFEMCENCRAEYENPENRRYFAQTNSCEKCGIRLRLFDCKNAAHLVFDQNEIFQNIISAWKSGKIVAIKSIGGYLLTCDATNPTAIATLRTRKKRPTKPFAVMFPDLEILKKEAAVGDPEIEHLQSPAAPIVLLEFLENGSPDLDRAGIAPGLQKIGAMLPNAPLFEILLRDFGKPIVATSGNVSNTPLIYDDEKAVRELSDIADFILMHDRDIEMPQDDSLILVRSPTRFSKNETAAAPIFLRRARGFAPTFIQNGLKIPEKTVLSLGADLKSTFALAHLGNLNISQYLGDLADFEAQERFEKVLFQFLKMFDAQPSVIVGDLHPGYFTTVLGQSLVEKWGVPFQKIQHHEAHFAAVLAENNLFEIENEPVLGVIWDGTGFGNDGQIWGGEFFIFSNQPGLPTSKNIRRCAHFEYFPHFLGDKMSREPRISALAACSKIPAAARFLKPKFSKNEWNFYQKMLAQPGQLMTSSVGRIFDAVASILGLADKVSYEGEAALLLENVARGYFKRHGFDFQNDFLNENVLPPGTLKIKTEHLFSQILDDLERGKARDFVAAKFHFSMTKIVRKISNQLNIKKIAFSGGVFQNSLLLDLMEYVLRPDCQLFFHKQLSANDENISFGQVVMAHRFSGLDTDFSKKNPSKSVSNLENPCPSPPQFTQKLNQNVSRNPR